MLIHPQFNPAIIEFGPLAIRWYAVSFIVGFILFMWLGRRRIRAGHTVFTQEMLDNFFTWGVLGVILGGRLGYVLFYRPDFYFAHPMEIFKVWQGGMSFHGGFLGVLIAMVLFARKYRISVLKVFDFIAPLTPLGFAAVRLGGNFVNGELWGRVTDPNAFWAMGFPQAAEADRQLVLADPERWAAVFEQYGMLPRHPSQLYQAALEGLLLFAVLWWFSGKPRPDGQTASLFLLGYGVARFIAEFAREPDDFLGLLSLGLSMGQWLSLPMMILGLIGMIWFGRRRPPAQTAA
ncbi:prolipoprotein diacylglyceryl transferase [Neisseria shayeganii]|uniref:Phosphatidylglycerol--prolipoprotein diacylglyceryl transferase n=1 Tax=Neisseria shayeganii 871 TaxID=1032488 RepID=G4CHI0_9NEIS|nr:prolipoprotein diacylglyceryl transferase [Neisseria shayeganii]EGY52710.1 prolipoprotein diacylglyceryl transferase [Neisseria shayeganii 871]